ncbi:MAG: transcriptional repressor LexA [Gammaproteobacteria bacterium]|nr:MAG: transcriptional repressor LexA [Gammaproteobacteria bacterium]
MQALTRRQEEILEFIRRHIQEQGAPPTRAEISEAFGFRSPNAAESHLRTLARKGYIEIVPGASRGIRLVGEMGLPVVGRVAAGAPILAEEHIEDHVQVDPGLFHPRADYLLRVRGDSMTGIGILDGDLLAVHRTGEARNGQVVVARIEDEVTVKRFRRSGARVWLEAEHPGYAPIEVDLRTTPFTIEGLAVGVVRTRGIP